MRATRVRQITPDERLNTWPVLRAATRMQNGRYGREAERAFAERKGDLASLSVMIPTVAVLRVPLELSAPAASALAFRRNLQPCSRRTSDRARSRPSTT
jgi:hypothetical protein